MQTPRTPALLLMLALLIAHAPVPTPAQESAPQPPPGVSTQLQSILGGALTSAPKANAPVGSTKFTPTGEALFLDAMFAQMTLDEAQKQGFRTYALEVVRLVEAAYVENGYDKNDLGVALGALLETAYELDQGTFKLGAEPTAEEKRLTRAAVRQMQNALGGVAAFKALPDKNKQTAYELCTFTIGHLAWMWQQAGGDATKQAEVRQTARQQVFGLFKFDPDAITRNAAGEFVPKSGSVAGTGSAASSGGAAKPPSASVWKNRGSGARPATVQPASPNVPPASPNAQSTASSGVAGWNSTRLAGGVMSYSPSTLAQGAEYTVAFYPAQPTNGKALRDWLLAAIEGDPLKPGASAMTPKISAEAGASAVNGIGAFTNASGERRVAIYTAVPVGNGSARLIRVMTSGGALLNQYKADTERLMNSAADVVK